MSQSVRDQLQKLGLVTEQKAKVAQREQKAGARQATKNRKARKASKDVAPAVPVDSARARAEAALRQRSERDREAARKRRLKEERAALRAQLAQIIDRRREPRSKGEIPYHFVLGKKIKRIYVTQELVDGLSAGHFGVVKTGERFEVVRREVAERLRELDPACVVSLHAPAAAPDPDDPYADKPIPDDLMW